MNPNAESNSKKEEFNQGKSRNIFENLKSKYLFKKIFENLNAKIFLKIIKYNKKFKVKLDISDKNYKEYCDIEIELIPKGIGEFINFINQEEEQFFHIYFNDDKNETKRNNLINGEKIKKIKLIIDYQVRSFYKLFYNCNCLESIKFIKFNRKDINNMSYMFYNCYSLQDLNTSNLITNNVTDMSFMFAACSSLIKLELSNFNTKSN